MGATGAITDVAGIRVGHVQKSGDGWLSGVTVVLPPPGTVGSVDVRGGGPATHETDSLDPTTLSQTVDAVVLTGGSAFGLAAAGGAMRWCEENGRGFPVPGGLVPIVPAAAIFDLGRGGDFSARPGRGDGLRGDGRRRRAAGSAWRFAVMAVLALWAVLDGVGRVYLGVHWATDVVAGWLLGLLLTVLAVGLSARVRTAGSQRGERRTVDPSGGPRAEVSGGSPPDPQGVVPREPATSRLVILTRRDSGRPRRRLRRFPRTRRE